MGPNQMQNVLAQQKLYDFTTDLSCKGHRILSAKKETPAPWFKKIKGGLETPRLTQSLVKNWVAPFVYMDWIRFVNMVQKKTRNRDNNEKPQKNSIVTFSF